MSFTRAAYDKCAYNTDIKSSIGPGAYALTRPLTDTSCMQSIPERGSAAGGHRYDTASLIDVDSELLGITRPYKRCRYPIQDVPHQQNIVFPECKLENATESSRLSNPPMTLRDNGVNRFTPLCFDPQKVTEVPFDRLVNMRLIIKDNHRPCIETPIDPVASLPPASHSQQDMQLSGSAFDYAVNVPKELAQYHQSLPMSITNSCTPAYFEKL